MTAKTTKSVKTKSKKKDDVVATTPDMEQNPSISLAMFPQEEVDGLIADAVEKAIRQVLKTKVEKVFKEEWDKVSLDNINEVSRQLIGKDYWAVIATAKDLARGDGPQDLTSINDTLMKLSGYYTSVSAALAVMDAQYMETYAGKFLEAKNMGYTDGTANQVAVYSCSDINYRKLMFRALRESIIETINVLKKTYDSIKIERTQLTHYS